MVFWTLSEFSFFAKSLILQVYDVLARRRWGKFNRNYGDFCTGAGIIRI